MRIQESRLLVFVALIVTIVGTPILAVDGKKAMYVGGTAEGIPEKAEGKLDTSNGHTLIFTPDKKGATTLALPYDRITHLEYGQKAGRRVGVAVMVSPLALFSKKRRHYLTVSYKDLAEKDQAAVLELGKDIVRTTLTVMETRTGKKIEYQDDEARKASRGN